MATNLQTESRTTTEIGLVAPANKKHFDVLRTVLLVMGERTLLPEIYEIFGSESVIKFLDIFAGTNVQIPGRDLLENAVRDTDIYVTINQCDSPDVTNELAIKYNIQPETVRDIYGSTKKMIESIYPKHHTVTGKKQPKSVECLTQ